ncbi:MAG: hypothetical protein Kow00109_10100 [Acidobacteriota bacterium]
MGTERELAVAFVVARLSSSRLPAKQLRSVGGKPLLAWTVGELRRCRELDRIVLATTADSSDDPLEGFARDAGIGCFRYAGDVNEVTTRLRRAAESEGAEICVLVSGDCPLLDAALIDNAVATLRRRPEADYVAWRPAKQHAALEGVLVARRRAWQLADDLADRPELKEHQFPVLYRRSELFQTAVVDVPEALCMPRHRWSVDTAADLEFFAVLHRELEAAGRPFTLREAVACVKRRPELLELNRHVRQRKVEDRALQVGFVIDAGGEYGYGHLSRCRELAWQLIERLSWSAEFLVDDEQAGRLLEEAGFRVRRGAVGRPSRLPAEVTETAAFVAECDFFVVDISDRRRLEPGWRGQFGKAPVVVIEQFADWARESDLVVAPNVLGKGREALGDWSGRVLEGPDYLILRRQVLRAAAGGAAERELDLFAYLHAAERAQALENWARIAGVRLATCTGWTDRFLDRLRQAWVFVSGFGVTFYEALVLGAVPVCWPDSEAHREDAVRFYRWLGVEPLLMEQPSDLGAVLAKVRSDAFQLPRLSDGTPRIVAAFAELAAART